MNSKQVRAFEGFVAESGDTLPRLATLLTSDPDTAEDVYQESATGAVLETAFVYRDEGSTGTDLYLSIAGRNTLPPDPYQH